MQRFNWLMAISAVAVLFPALAWAGDRETAQQIADAIRKSGSLNDYAIGVKYKDGTAWLKGNVRSPQQMAQAVRIAESASEVQKVVNQLEIPTSAQLAWRDTEPSRPAASADSFSSRLSRFFLGRPTQRQVAKAQSSGATRSAASSSRRRSGSRSTADSFDASLVSASEVVEQGSLPSASAGKPGPGHIAIPAAAAQSTAASRALPGVYRPVSQAMTGAPIPTYVPGTSMGVAPVAYDHPHMPAHAWPSYAAHPNYAGVTYPRQYSPTAWPYIGPFYPYPQVPLGWRKVTLEWDDGWWFLDFDDKNKQHDGCWWW